MNRHTLFTSPTQREGEDMQRSGRDTKHQSYPDEILTDPPFYSPQFEESYRYIIDEYEVEPRPIAIFLPCAMRKPYSTSPSHRIFRAIISRVLDPSDYHIVIFGTCGILPAELEEMYPYTHYRYMLGKVEDEAILADFVRIETGRVAGYLEKTRTAYQCRLGYCIGLFREALIRGSDQAAVPIDIICPTRDLISTVVAEEDCPFQEGSLSMDQYLDEFHQALITLKKRISS
jgi:archaeosine synthase alpha-subunit